MRTLFEAAGPFGGPTDVDAAVRSRLERRSLFDRDNPPTVSCVLSESCVRRMVGGPEVMAAQLRHLADLGCRPRVQLQMWPFHGEIAGVGVHQFTMLRIPAPRADSGFTFVYCEDLDDARYIDDPASVRAYDAVWGARQAAALGPAETRSRLLTLAQQFVEGPHDDPQGSDSH